MQVYFLILLQWRGVFHMRYLEIEVGPRPATREEALSFINLSERKLPEEKEGQLLSDDDIGTFHSVEQRVPSQIFLKRTQLSLIFKHLPHESL